ncbi:MAG: FeoA family protein, partial [Sciscionella sp.]
GQRAVLVRVSAPDPAMLRYLSERGIAIGDELEMLGREPFDGPGRIRIRRHTHALGPILATAIRVR